MSEQQTIIRRLDDMEDLSHDSLSIIRRWIDERMENLRLRGLRSGDTADDFKQQLRVKELLKEQGASMPGPDSTLLACAYAQFSGADMFNARQVSAVLMESDCKPANITTVMEGLLRRQYLDMVAGDEVGRHKCYRLTVAGLTEARRLIESLSRKEKVADFHMNGNGRTPGSGSRL